MNVPQVTLLLIAFQFTIPPSVGRVHQKRHDFVLKNVNGVDGDAMIPKEFKDEKKEYQQRLVVEEAEDSILRNCRTC